MHGSNINTQLYNDIDVIVDNVHWTCMIDQKVQSHCHLLKQALRAAVLVAGCFRFSNFPIYFQNGKIEFKIETTAGCLVALNFHVFRVGSIFSILYPVGSVFSVTAARRGRSGPRIHTSGLFQCQNCIQIQIQIYLQNTNTKENAMANRYVPQICQVEPEQG